MDEQIKNEINGLKEEIRTQKEAVQDIHHLVKQDLKKRYPTDLWELSEKELDNEMGSRLSFLNDDIDPKPDNSVIITHRSGILGKVIVRFKRILMKLAQPYTNLLLEKQRRFNEQLVAYHLASFIRFRSTETHIQKMDKKLKELEEDQELLMDLLKNVNPKNDHDSGDEK
jgi:hypothetical protein